MQGAKGLSLIFHALREQSMHLPCNALCRLWCWIVLCCGLLGCWCACCCAVLRQLACRIGACHRAKVLHNPAYTGNNPLQELALLPIQGPKSSHLCSLYASLLSKQLVRASNQQGKREACLSLGEGVRSAHRTTSCATADATVSRTTASASLLSPAISGWITVFSLAGTCPLCTSKISHHL